MLALKVQNTWLDLPPKLQVTFNYHNPIFDDEAIERVYSYPMTIQLTPKNRAFFQNVERLDVDVNNDEYPAQMFLNGIEIENGIVKMTGYRHIKKTQDYIKIVFQNKARNLMEQLSKIKINKILDVIPIPQSHLSRFVLHAPNFAPLHIEIEGISFYEGITSGNQNTFDMLLDLAEQINNTFSDIHATVSSDNNLTIQNPNNLSISFRIIQGFELIENTPVARARQLNMISYVNNIVNNPSPSHSFVTTFNHLFYESENDAWLGFINYWRDGDSIENSEQELLAWEHTFVPYVRSPYLFQKIMEQLEDFGTIFGIFYDSLDAQQMLIYNHYALDEVFQFLSVDTIQKMVYMNGFKNQIDLNEHVLDITADDWFKAWAEITCTHYRIKGNDIEVIRKVDQLRITPIDWTHRAEPSYDGNNQLNQGVTLDYQRDPEDNYPSSTQLQPAVIGQGESEINITISTLHEITQTVNILDKPFDWKVPVVRQAGSSDETGKSSHSLRLFFDRGLHPDSLEKSYPMGSHSTTNYPGNEVGDLSLDWNDPKGLYPALWQEYADLIDKDEITIQMRLYVTDILHIKNWKNSRRIIRHYNGTLIGVIKSVQFKASPVTGMGIATIVFVKS